MFTTEEVNECMDFLQERGPELISVEVIELMRTTLLEHAED